MKIFAIFMLVLAVAVLDFTTVESQSRVDDCFLSSNTGRHCGPATTIKRFFYNYTTRKCEPFTFRGCGGNDNRFDSMEDCKARCNQNILLACRLPYKIGRCRSIIPKFYYNAKAGQCQHFNYGGCGGNENRFNTKKVCRDMCIHGNFTIPPTKKG